MPKAPRFFVETARLLLPKAAARDYLESTRKLPTALYPAIRVLTADKATQNKTYYPLESLVGDPEEGTGLISFIRPYPVPVIRDHLTAPGMFGGYASDVYGRVLELPSIGESDGMQYIQASPSITHPEAIENIMDGRWMTVSLGSRVASVNCSICGADLTDEDGSQDCDHEKGTLYDTAMGQQEALWRIGPIRAKEISFVVTPSDDQARVLDPSLPYPSDPAMESALPVAAGFLVGNEAGIFDLATGIRVADKPSAGPAPARPSPARRPFRSFSLPGLHGRVAEASDYCWSCTPGTPGNLLEAGETPLAPEAPLTYGTLYLLDATDEEAGAEASLTTKQRDKLPDSAFCGPNRSFPAHNTAHVTAGLRLLGRAKLSGEQKDRVRACLIRKGKRMGMTFDNEAAHAARLVDEAHGVEIALYPLPRDAAELAQVTAQVTAMPHTPLERTQIMGRIAQSAKAWMSETDWEQAFGTAPQEAVADGPPIVIAVGSENYALLYAAAELEGPGTPGSPGSEQPVEAAGGPADPVAETVTAPAPPEPEAVLDPAIPAEVAPPAAPPTAAEVTALPAGALPPGALPDPSLPETPTLPASLTAAPTVVATETAPEVADTLPLEEAIVNPEAIKSQKLETLAREALAHTVALYMRSLRKVASRGKSQVELVQLLASRTIESLTDSMNDLALEWDSSETSEIARLPVLTDPTAPAGPVSPAEEAALTKAVPSLTPITELPLEEGEPETITVKTSNFLLELFPNLS